MLTSIIVGISGPDRPGLVKLVSDCAIRHEANWADSVFANFAGRFCGFVHLQVHVDRAEGLIEALHALPGSSLAVHAEYAGQANARVDGPHVALKLLGNDRPGITQAIASKLAQLGVNILKLQSHIESAPMSGANLFSMEMSVVLPQSLGVEQLQVALEAIASELMVDMSLTDV